MQSAVIQATCKHSDQKYGHAIVDRYSLPDLPEYLKVTETTHSQIRKTTNDHYIDKQNTKQIYIIIIEIIIGYIRFRARTRGE